MSRRVTETLLWAGAILISFVPGVIAVDSGGAFPWSYWALAATTVFPVLCGILVIRSKNVAQGIQPHLLTLLLLACAAFAFFQIQRIPSGMTRVLTPGSYSAWTEWIPAWVPSQDVLGNQESMPISVAPRLTAPYVWNFVTLAALAWCGSTLFESRNRLMLLLTVLSISGAAHSIIGIWQICLFPDRTFWGLQEGVPFGFFLNRNNAATFLNISFACSLGLIGWRLAAVTGHEFGQKDFSFSNVLDLVSDRASCLAILSICITVAGLLACGSRGGLAGSLVGLTFAMGLFRSSRIFKKLLVTLCLLTVLSITLLGSIDVSPRTLERFGATAVGLNESLLENGRIPHWKNSLRAIGEYLPAGSGFGTYRYAYLPYEEIGSNEWFLNADNLWLEFALEGGIFAIFAMIFTLSILVYALIQLNNTLDPMDHGISTAGFMGVAALSVSEAFDFGLLLAGSSSAAALLFGAVLSRAAADGTPLLRQSGKSGNRISFEAIGGGKLKLSLLLCFVLMGPFTLTQLAIFAKEDAFLRSINFESDSSQTLIDSSLVQLNELENKNPLSFQIPLAKAQLVASNGARVLDEKLRSDFSPKIISNYYSGKPYRFLSRLDHLTTTPSQIDTDLLSTIEKVVLDSENLVADFKTRIRDQLAKSIGRCPLAAEPRFLALEYHLFSSDNNADLKMQVMNLRRGVNQTLTLLAGVASDEGDWPTVTTALKMAVENQPHRTNLYLQVADELGHPNNSSIVTNSIEAVEGATNYYLRTGQRKDAFFEHAFAVLSEEFPESRSQRSARYLLLGRICQVLKDYEKAKEAFLKSIELEPNNLQIRFAYLDALVNAGDRIQAKRYAEELRTIYGSQNTLLEKKIRVLSMARKN